MTIVPTDSESPAASTSPDLTAAIDRAAQLIGGGTVGVLTGAGISTDSGIPDYRGAGAPVRTPMVIGQFLGDERARKRYWAGSHLGWRFFSTAQPNAGHLALAQLELAGVVPGIVTQNVDGLHLRAGSRKVVDIHGSVDRVRCLNCGQIYSRDGISERMAAANPWLDAPDGVELNPDGDVTIEAVEDMVIPECTVCGGMLKPEVVFFGEYVPSEKFVEASALLRNADALLVAGSSLVVNSGIRLLDLAVRRRMPIIILNRGATKGDRRATLKIDAGTSEVLTGLRDRLAPGSAVR